MPEQDAERAWDVNEVVTQLNAVRSRTDSTETHRRFHPGRLGGPLA